MKTKLVLFLSVVIFMLTSANMAMAKTHKVRTMGTVESIDLEKKTFVVKQVDDSQVTIHVLPNTELEVEHKNSMKFDYDIELKELKVGDWVKVKSIPLGDVLQADEVEVRR